MDDADPPLLLLLLPSRRCLLHWLQLNQKGKEGEAKGDGTEGGAAAAPQEQQALDPLGGGVEADAAAWVAQQNALPCCLPCVRLLSGARRACVWCVFMLWRWGEGLPACLPAFLSLHPCTRIQPYTCCRPRFLP